ncbi:MAG: DUF1571 domain-containing protein, partial [Gemmataceae bacterium]|nr:DUF1571 domain-containing protein [Gemmataceae bacterium]
LHMANIRIVPALPVLALALAGCFTTPPTRPDIPLVPVPPPPLGRPPEEIVPVPVKPAASETPAPKAEERPKAVPTARDLVKAATARIPDLDSYIVRLTKREIVGGRATPEEVMLFKFRARPWSVHLKWLGKEGQGREVLLVKGRHGDNIHTLLAAGDFPLMPAGKRMSFSPDNIFVKNSCRHSITQAGLIASVERLGKLLSDIEAGDKKAGTVAVLPPAARPEFAKPAAALEHTLPPGSDPTLPKGGKRTYWFCPETGLPMLCIALDERGREAEYYKHDRLHVRQKLDDDDFDPDKLFPKPSKP